MSEAKTTTDPKIIKRWAEERGGHPATVKGTAKKGEAGLLRIDFPVGREDHLESLDWEEFFDKFEEEDLAFLYQEQTEDGSVSRFCKFVSRK